MSEGIDLKTTLTCVNVHQFGFEIFAQTPNDVSLIQIYHVNFELVLFLLIKYTS